MTMVGSVRMFAIAGACLLAAPAIVQRPAAADQADGAAVAVTGGRIAGTRLAAGGAVFKGIPFAAPPVGDLRWRAPAPVKPWKGVRPATSYGDSCAQADSGWNKPAVMQSSENCLFLNVWTPDWPAKGRLPVMVWIHGGANNGGSAKGGNAIEPPFDGESLSRQGVLLVTLNYRLGLFGFVGHPEAQAESAHHASGNYGILDQVAALRWVHDNIAKFGGDPKNVTVFGQSAGAQDTSILVTSPLTRGLMQKAIVESGSPMIGDRKLLTPEQTAHLGILLARALKAPSEQRSLRYLRGLSTAQILAANADFRKALAEEKLGLDVSIDGYAVPRNPGAVYRAKMQHPIPMIVGSNAKDSPGYRPNPNATAATTEAVIRQRVGQIYGAYPEMQARALRFYGMDGGMAQVYPPYGPLDYQLAVDYSFRCGGTAVARWQNAVAPTFRYEFTAGTPAHPPVHSGELDYVFGYLRDQASEPALANLSQQMQRYWANFARTGNPNGGGLPAWPRYDAKGSYVELGNEGPMVKVGIRGGLCDLYADKVDRALADAAK